MVNLHICTLDFVLLPHTFHPWLTLEELINTTDTYSTATTIYKMESNKQNQTCLCCCICCSSICARSVSNITGSARMAAEDANTHRPEQLRPYSVLEALQEKELMPLVKERTPSGNISVKPHSLSEKVSSKS